MTMDGWFPEKWKNFEKKSSPGRVALDVGIFWALVSGVVILYLFLLSLFRNISSLPAVVLAAGCFGLNALFLRRRGLALQALGLGSPRKASGRVAIGFAAGILLVFLWFGVVGAVLSPRVHFVTQHIVPSLTNLFLFYGFNSLAEEFVYRGYAFVRLGSAFGRTVAIFGTSVIFALLHVQGGLPWVSALTVVLTSGLIFAALFYQWKSLPLAFGFHFATNVGQDLIGLRDSSLSFLKLSYPPLQEHLGIIVLLAISLINVVVFVGLMRRPRVF